MSEVLPNGLKDQKIPVIGSWTLRVSILAMFHRPSGRVPKAPFSLGFSVIRSSKTRVAISPAN